MLKTIHSNNVRLISHPRRDTADNCRELLHGAFLNTTHSAVWGDTLAPEPLRFNQAKQMICLSYSGAWQSNATPETSIIDGASWLQSERGQQNIYQHLVWFTWTARLLFVWLFFLQLYNCCEPGTDRQRCVHLQLSRVCFVFDIQCVSTPLWLSCTC